MRTTQPCYVASYTLLQHLSRSGRVFSSTASA